MPTPTEPGSYWWRQTRLAKRGAGYCSGWLYDESDIPVPLFVYWHGCLKWDQAEPCATCGTRIAPSVRALYADFRGGSAPVDYLAEYGEWGPRIPSPERLEAMEQLAAHSPSVHIESGFAVESGHPQWDKLTDCKFGRAACFYCGEPMISGHIEHKADCPWLRAQEKGDTP